MKLIVMNKNRVVLSVSETNLEDNAQAGLILVGENIVLVVPDSDAHNVGDTYSDTPPVGIIGSVKEFFSNLVS